MSFFRIIYICGEFSATRKEKGLAMPENGFIIITYDFAFSPRKKGVSADMMKEITGCCGGCCSCGCLALMAGFFALLLLLAALLS